MLTPEQIQLLSQVNIAKDGEKVKERLRDIWGNLNRDDRSEVTRLSGISKYSIERAYKKGNISAKLVAAIAQSQRINPFYLTGESDGREGYSDEVLSSFLSDKKMKLSVRGKVKASDEFGKPAAKTPRGGRAAKTAAPASKSVGKIAPVSDDSTLNKLLTIVSDSSDVLDNISDDEYILLFKSMLLRAKFNDDADDVLRLIKFFLAF